MRTEFLLPRLNGRCVGEVRRDMMGRGFALVDTPPFFGDTLCHRLRRLRMALLSRDKRWRQSPELARYACWLEALLDEALSDEAISLTSLEFRHEPAGYNDPEVDRLHADGSYIRSVFTLYGPATVYREGCIEQSVPDGKTLLMTALDRAKAVHRPCTLHRRPGAGPERAVIVGSFEPRPELSPQASFQPAAVQELDRRRKSRGGQPQSVLRNAKLDTLQEEETYGG